MHGDRRPGDGDSYDPQRRAAEAQAAQANQAAQAIAATIASLDAQLAQAVLDLQATQARLTAAQTALAAAQQTLEQSQREAVLITGRLQDAQALQAHVSTNRRRRRPCRASPHRCRADGSPGVQGRDAATGFAVVVDAKNSQDFVSQYAMVTTALRIQAQNLGDLQQIMRRAGTARRAFLRWPARSPRSRRGRPEGGRGPGRPGRCRAQQAAIQQLLADQTAQQAAITG